MPPLRRPFAIAILATVCALWIGAATHNWRVDQLAKDQWHLTLGAENNEAGETTRHPPSLPLAGGDAARQWARRLITQPGTQSDLIQTLLNTSLTDRPLYGPTWLDQAQLQASAGDPEAASRSIEIARALWPQRARLLQRAAWMQVGLGTPDLALAVLLDYWATAPADWLRTLALARRLAPEPEALIDAAAHVWQRGLNEPLIYQRSLMDLARRAGDRALAQTLWSRLDDESRTQEALLFPYLQMLAAQGQHADADAVWEQALGPPPGLANGSFAEPLVPLGPEFSPGWATPGWRYRPAGDGFRITLDPLSDNAAPRALNIAFLGTHNVNFSHLSQVIRVHPGQSYRLTGYWSGDSITTRSGVLIEIYTIDSRPVVQARTPPRRGSWDREPFALDIQVPDDALLVGVRVLRSATKALDNLLSGTVRLDTLELQPLP